MTDKEIGVQIKKARQELGLSQEQLGTKLGVTWEMISRYENGRSSARKYLVQLAQVLEKPVSYFFGVYDNKSNIDTKKLIETIKDEIKGTNISYNGKVLIIDDLSILGFEKSLKFAQKYYTAPDWIVEKYKNVFALRLDEINLIGLEKNTGDVGFFVTDVVPQKGDYVLVDENGRYSICPHDSKKSHNILAILLVQEKRYR